MKNPKVSIIIPVLNGEKTIKNCLTSVLNQTYKNYEIIVIDNNSTDKTKEIIFNLAKKDKRIFYYLEKIKSRGASRNLGIHKSKGEIIVMIDSDCIAPKEWLIDLINPLVNSNENIVLGNYSPKILNYWTKKIQKYDTIFKNSQVSGNYISILDTKNLAIKKIVLEKIKNKEKYFNSSLVNMEDFELGLRLLNYYKIFFLKNNKIIHNDNDSFKKWISKQFNRAYWINKIKNNLNKGYQNKNPMFNSIEIKNNLLLPLFLIKTLIKNPNDFLFILNSEISWRAGLLYSRIK